MTAAVSVVSDRSRASFRTKSARGAAHGDEMPWPALIEGPGVYETRNRERPDASSDVGPARLRAARRHRFLRSAIGRCPRWWGGIQPVGLDGPRGNVVAARQVSGR